MTLSNENENKYFATIQYNVCEIRKGLKREMPSAYKEPDKLIEEVINGYRIAPDGICGIKYMIDFLDEESDLAENYEILRSIIILWPRHRGSINQKRYAKFRDRFDFTLFDISNVYNDMETFIVKKDSLTYKWLKKSFSDFSDFCKKMGYNCFLNKSNTEVYNLSIGTGEEKTISSIQEYTYGKEINQRYLTNVLKILKKEQVRVHR